jgi:hypothetical protein
MSAAGVAKRSVIGAARVVGLGLLFGSGGLAWAQDAPTVDPTMDAIERQLEVGRHEPLLARIAQSSLNAFSTDGCSGGLSAGWEQIAARFPEFAANHGEEPPWQDCCVAHDRAYHRGGVDTGSAEQSFERRRAADLALRACVVETGIARSGELGGIYGLTEAQIRGLYLSIAELMYRAVRLGGIPCTDLPWRWGYGWPRCE